MCEACTRSRLAAEIDVLSLEVAVISAEVAAGENWPGASRALTAAEAHAGMRFGELDRMGDQAAALIARHAADVRTAVSDQLINDLTTLATKSSDPYTILARLQALGSPTSGTSLPIQEAIDQATRQILEVLAHTHVQAAGTVVAEAEHQGLSAAALPDQRTFRPTTTQRRQLEVLARQVAESPVTRVLEVATREARSAVTPNTHPSAVVQAVDVAVRNISPAGVQDAARQAATSAVNSGRLTAAQAAPEPREIYASEIMDSNTCGPCSQVDGRMYDSMESALADYPAGGSFKNCLGGSRCRGTLVFVWESEQAPSLDQPGDRPVPKFPIDRTPRGPITDTPPVALPKAVGAEDLGPEPPAGGVAAPPPTPPRPAAPSGAITAEQYQALTPTSSWSEAKRAEILDALGSTPQGKILGDTLSKFQDGGSISRLRTNIDKHLAGEALDPTSTARVESLLDAIRHSPEEWAPETLFRGMSVKGKPENILAKYVPGEQLDLSLTSFTSDRKVATRFQQISSGKSTSGRTRIMVELVGPGKKALPIQNLPKDQRLFREKEWVSAGRFRIVEAKKSPNGAIIVRITQEGTL